LRRGETSVIIANAVGAFLAQLYFVVNGSITQEPSDAGGPTFILISAVAVAALLMLGRLLGARGEKALRTWYLNTASLDDPDDVPAIVQQQALNTPISSALVSMAMWVLAGFAFGMGNSMTQRAGRLQIDVLSLTVFVFTFAALPGFISATLAYFIMERVWRSEIPIFFPNGVVTHTKGFRMSLRRRILVLFIIQALPLLLLAVSAYSQVRDIAQADNPQVLVPQFLGLELYIVGVGVLSALALAFTLGTSLITGVETLNNAMNTVQNGDLEATLSVTSNDEFGALSEGFNAMVKGLQKEETIRNLFSVYVTPEVAEHAIEHGAELGGHLSPATVLFSDIRSFTALTERTEPEHLIAMLNRYFQVMSEVIVANGGFVNKFGGDSLLAVFGTPLNPAQDHADRAVRTAEEMLQALLGFNADQEARGEPSVHIGIGIATGPVIAGNVGSRQRLEYTVIGDTVNLASRLEEMTKTLATPVLISHTTIISLTGPTGDLAALGETEVRGKAAPVLVYGFQKPAKGRPMASVLPPRRGESTT
jgi:class 3 adenylate cyclase